MIFATALFFPSFILIENYFSKGYVYFAFLVFLPFAVYYTWISDGKDPVPVRLLLSLVFVIVVYILVSGYIGQLVWGEEKTRFAVTGELMVKFMLPFVLYPVFSEFRVDGNFVRSAIILSGFSLYTAMGYNLAINADRDHILFGGPIIWGNLALMTGLFAFILARHEHSVSNRWVLAGVAVVGLFASFYSGTRGGWIVLLTVPFFYLFLFAEKRKVFKRVLLIIALIVFFSLVLYIFIPWVHDRINHAVTDIKWIFAGDFSGSIGMRFLIWWAALKAFMSSYFMGVGMGNFYAFKAQLISQGELPSMIMRFKHEHSMYMTIVGSLGIIGVILFSVLFIFLFRSFKNLLESPQTFIWGEMGLILLLAYLDFGLSESYLFTHIGAAAFFFWVTLLLYLGYGRRKA